MWWFENKEFHTVPQDIVGFVYCITNLKTNRKYIGKKGFWVRKTRSIKKKRKRILAPSDWESYYGSSRVLQEDVELLGKDSFRREILRLCKTKGECSYWEAKLQFQFGVLENPDQYYNEYIGCRINRKHFKGFDVR